MSNPLKFCLFICLCVIGLSFSFPQLPAQASYADIVTEFESIRSTTTAPVEDRTFDEIFDDIRSTFGPRILSSSGSYDFHRAIDIEGSTGEDIVAPLDGYFAGYRTYNSCGKTVRLRHNFPSPIQYKDKTINQFYTWYCHLDDFVSGFTDGQSIPEGTVIGKLGKSGSATYPHLHLELRVGTNNSLEYQKENYDESDPRYFGFDPHMHPMLLFEPYTYGSTGSNSYTQNLTLSTPTPTAGSDVTIEYKSTNDNMPLLNRVEVVITNSSGIPVSHILNCHTLDLNQREGFDASSTSALDTPDTDYPYFKPEPWSSGSSEYKTNIVIPGGWTSGYGYDKDSEVTVTAYDIWDNNTSLSFTLG